MRWPQSLKPRSNQLALIQPSRVFQSKFTAVEQSVTLPGARWELSMTFRGMKPEQRRQMEALTDQLAGKTEVIQVYDHLSLRSDDVGSGIVAIAGSGRTLQTSGWLPGTRIFRCGDMVTINGELKRIQEDIRSSSIGAATLVFNPPLRNKAPAGAAIEYKVPWMWAKQKDDQASFSRNSSYAADCTLKFVEAIHK